MTEPSNINPDIIFKFKLTPTINMKNPEFLSFCNSEFNPQIAKVTEKVYDITFGHTQAQDSDEFSFLKSPEMINIPCRKPIISISQINEDDDDNESSNHTIFDESGCFGAWTLVPMKVKKEDHVIPVRKSADAPGENANMLNNGNVYGNGNAGYNNGVPVLEPNNAVNNGAAAANNNGDIGGHDNQNLNNNGNFDWGIIVYECNADSYIISGFLTNAVPMHHGSWFEFAGRVHQFWQLHSGQATVLQLAGAAPVPMSPADCWPGHMIFFGRFDGVNFTDLSWPHHDWQDVQAHIRCACVIPEAHNNNNNNNNNINNNNYNYNNNNNA